MPRLTNHQYLARRTTLHVVWLNHRQAFAVASLEQQWELHRYHQTQVDASANELLANRQALTAADPSLPQRAGKTYVAVVHAYARLTDRKAVVLTPASSGGRPKERVLSIRAVARPVPDIAKLVLALRQLAEQQAQTDKDQFEAA